MTDSLPSTSVTVGDLRRWLDGFDDDATVVVPAGRGYEEPRIRTTTVRPVIVAQRYVYDQEGATVVVLSPVHG